jgi:hypothetical protein
MLRTIHHPLFILVSVSALVFGGTALAATAFLASATGSSAASGVSGLQSDILSDGIVTEAEYHSSVMAVRTCLEDAGIRVGQLKTSHRQLIFDFGGAPTLEEANKQATIYKGCFTRYSEEVTMAWLDQHADELAAEAQQIRAGIAACLRDRGHALPATVLPDDLAGLRGTDLETDLQECSALFADENGFLHY